MAEWPAIPLSDLVEDDSPITYGVVKPGHDPHDGVFFIRGGDISDGQVQIGALRRIDQAVSEQYRRTLLRGGELVVSLVGNPGQVALVPESLRGANIARQVGLVRLGATVVPLFVKYYLSSHTGQVSLGSHSIGSVQQVINLRDLKTVAIPVPPLDEQRAIASVLGSLDDKIELNRRMNRTLEQMAAAIFKAWFVDFEPVRAKASGAASFPGMPQPVFDALPATFADSELGPIPEGWEASTVQDLCTSITSGGTPARRNSEYWDGGTISWFKTGELHDGPLLDSSERITEAALANSSCKLWPADTVLFALYASPTVGRLGILTRDATSNQAAAGLIAKTEYGTQFLVHTLLQARDGLQQIAVGAAQQNINQGVLKSHKTVVPPEAVVSAFSEVALPLYDLRVSLAKESHALAETRDALLPKLLSGEVRVGEPEVAACS